MPTRLNASCCSGVLCNDVYADFSVRHFYEHVTEKHQVRVSYNWLRLMLQEAGVVEKEPAWASIGAGAKRQPMVGMLVRLDASTHERGLSIASIQRIATGVSSATCSMTPMLQRLSTVRGSKARNSVLLFSGREIGVKYFSSEVRRAGVERDADEQRHDSSRPSVGLDVRFQHSVHARLVPSGLSKTGPSKIRMASSKSMACLAILAAFLAMCHSNAIQV